MGIEMTRLYTNLKNFARESLLFHALFGSLIMGGIPAFSYLIARIIGCPETEGIMTAVVVSATGGASGGIAIYLTRTMFKKGGWRAYLSFIIIFEAYILITITGILLVAFLYPFLRDNDFDNIFMRPIFYLFIHLYAISLATITFGLYSLQKLMRRRKNG
ncbi:MAG: hypothetical protein ABSF37_11435 [Sedimentisphaerales bacterium]|jgi:hypothetical protein